MAVPAVCVYLTRGGIDSNLLAAAAFAECSPQIQENDEARAETTERVAVGGTDSKFGRATSGPQGVIL